MTAYAAGLILDSLQKRYAAGNDAIWALRESVKNNWTDVYPAKAPKRAMTFIPESDEDSEAWLRGWCNEHYPEQIETYSCNAWPPMPFRHSKGTEYRSCCPFHGGNNDSALAVDLEDGKYFCFACNAKGKGPISILLELVAAASARKVERERLPCFSEYAGPTTQGYIWWYPQTQNLNHCNKNTSFEIRIPLSPR